jgi:hypothetical protein
VSKLKPRFGYDDALDAFGCHGVGGIFGGLCTGIFASMDVNPAIAWNGLVFGETGLFVAQIVSIAPAVIVDKAEVGSVKTVDQPWSSGRPVSPNKKRYIFVFAIAGALLMCMFLILRELMNNTFKTEADITRELGLPILGVIPLEEGGLVAQGTDTKRKK